MKSFASRPVVSPAGRRARASLVWLASLGFLLTLASPRAAHAVKCPPGFAWDRMSGVGCFQKDCFTRGGHWSDTKRCNCKPGRKACRCPVLYGSFDKKQCSIYCPRVRLDSCIAPAATCPACPGQSVGRKGQEPTPSGGEPPPETTVVQPGTQPQGKVLEVRGKVEVRRGPGRPWEPIAAGQSYDWDAELRTGKRARLKIALPGTGGKLTLGPQTRIKIGKWIEQRWKRVRKHELSSPVLRFLKGKIRYFTRKYLKRGKGLRIKAEFGPGAIRGTDLITLYRPAPLSGALLVREGEVQIKGVRRGAAVVRGGQRVEVKNGVVGPVRRLSPAEWRTALADLAATAGPTPKGSAGAKLGSLLKLSELGFKGTFRRQGRSNTWVGSWAGGCRKTRLQLTAKTVLADGKLAITLRRTDLCSFSSGLTAVYRGFVNPRTGVFSGTRSVTESGNVPSIVRAMKNERIRVTRFAGRFSLAHGK